MGIELGSAGSSFCFWRSRFRRSLSRWPWALIGLLMAMMTVGCGQNRGSTTSRRTAEQDSKASSQANDEDQESADDQKSTASDADRTEPDLDVQGELETYVAKFNDQVDWRFHDREEGRLAGEWRCTDGRGKRVIFWPDGRYSEDFAGQMTIGRYAISREGRVAAVSRSATAQVNSHYWFDGDSLFGTNGPLPRVRWEKAGPAPD